MHVKYIVYYLEDQSIPIVDIWATEGEMTHVLYAKTHNIKSQNISSEGYLNFDPKERQWKLEHYQMENEQKPSFTELVQRRHQEIRDRLLVSKKIRQTPFLNNPTVQGNSLLATSQFQKTISLLKSLFFKNNQIV